MGAIKQLRTVRRMGERLSELEKDVEAERNQWQREKAKLEEELEFMRAVSRELDAETKQAPALHPDDVAVAQITALVGIERALHGREPGASNDGESARWLIADAKRQREASE